jgi:hypothetical protein
MFSGEAMRHVNELLMSHMQAIEIAENENGPPKRMIAGEAFRDDFGQSTRFARGEGGNNRRHHRAAACNWTASD